MSGSAALPPDMLSILCDSSAMRASKAVRPSAGVIALSEMMHLVEAALDAFQRGGIGAASVAAVDALGERVHLALQRFEFAARQRFMDRACDFGEVAAQGGDHVLDAGRTPQRLDLRRDAVQLTFKAGKIRMDRGRLRRLRCGSIRGGGIGCGSRRGFVERALARGDFRNGLIDPEVERLRRNRGRPFLGIRGPCSGGRRPARGQLLEPRIELRDGVGKPCAAQRRLAQRLATCQPWPGRAPAAVESPKVEVSHSSTDMPARRAASRAAW